MESEQRDEFELELKQALERRPAPPRLKQRIMQARAQRQDLRRHRNSVVWMRLAATLVIVALLGGGVGWWSVQRQEERRRGEEARRQVMIALRIAGHALNEVNARLTERRGPGE